MVVSSVQNFVSKDGERVVQSFMIDLFAQISWCSGVFKCFGQLCVIGRIPSHELFILN